MPNIIEVLQAVGLDKGRHHTEQNYMALVAAYDATKETT